MIIGLVVHLVFAVLKGTADETTWTVTLTGIVTGIGLVFSGDAGASAKAHAESQVQIAELQQKVEKVPQAIATGDTSMIQRIPTTPVAIVNEKP